MTRIFLAAIFASFSICESIASTDISSSFPQKPIRMIVPFGAGSATDLFARSVAEAMGQQTGKVVVVENKPGASGFFGSCLS